MTTAAPFWWRQMASAIRLNARSAALAIIAKTSPSHMMAATSTAGWLRLTLPYRFDGADHRILSLPEARRRGYGACGDATAAIAAVLLHRGEPASIAYEASETLDGYAHVRVVLGRVPVDAYPEMSLQLEPRAVLQVTRETVRWPAPVRDEPQP